MKAARVLIVDDDRSSAVAICCYLEFKGHDVAVAASVDEALTVAENLVPEILICDWKLGEDRDGIDVARLLNDRYELTIIFMTAHEPDELQRKLDGLTPAGCFRKPVVLEELVQAMGHPPSSGYVLAVSCRKVIPSSQSDDTYGSTVAKWDEQTARWQMNAHKRKDTDPDEYGPAETIVLEEDAVMETSEFRKLVALDPDSFDEIGPPDLED